jgi:hypothetical protein
MVLRDAVVNDRIPRINQNPQGYFAYRFGHAAFRYIQENYGWDGLRDFIYEYRNTLGNSVDRALKRALNLTPDEFDTRFRSWLRKQYLPALVAKGEPQEYGEPFRISTERGDSNEISPVPSPSGDLLTAFTTYKEDVDAVLFNIPERRLLKNLTSGYTSEYEYPIVQAFTTAARMGRDIAFAPNGDQIAFFVKKERGRNLLLLNPISGRIERSISMPVEQQLNPAYSPDGRTIAFTAIAGNQSDIFLYDIESGGLTNVTSDAFYDGSSIHPSARSTRSCIDSISRIPKSATSSRAATGTTSTPGSRPTASAFSSPPTNRPDATSSRRRRFSKARRARRARREIPRRPIRRISRRSTSTR